jgi:hypothetical protein
MFKEIFFIFLLLNIFVMCPTARSGFRYCFGLRGKGGSESETRRLEFLSSQVGNPNASVYHADLLLQDGLLLLRHGSTRNTTCY